MTSLPTDSLVMKNVNFLITLLNSVNKSPKHLKLLLTRDSDEEIETIVEIVQNFLSGNEIFSHDREYMNRMRRFSRLF